MFKIIACINKKMAIGNEGNLIYVIKNDMANFASMTKYNGVVIMGRKTFESLPDGKPLDERINIVLTNDEKWGVEPSENLFIVHSVLDAVELCETVFPDKEWFVIGGESIYQQFLDCELVDEMRLTVVNDNADGDVFFPKFNDDEWYVYYKSMAQTSTWKGVDKSFIFYVLKKNI